MPHFTQGAALAFAVEMDVDTGPSLGSLTINAFTAADEIIIPIAFRLNTYCTHVFRTWLVGKALSKEKRQAYVMFIQNGKAGYC